MALRNDTAGVQGVLPYSVVTILFMILPSPPISTVFELFGFQVKKSKYVENEFLLMTSMTGLKVEST